MSAIVRPSGIRSVTLRSCTVLLLLPIVFTSGMAAESPQERTMFPDRQDRVTDPESKLEGSLTVLRGSDGGAATAAVELANPSEQYDVVLKINAEVSALIMLTVADQQGNVLSKPARRFNSSEIQRFDIVRIAPGSSHRWLVPIAAQLDASTIPKLGLNGRLVVNIALLFSKVQRDGRPADADFKSSLLTLHDMDVLFTQQALSDGTKQVPDEAPKKR